MWPRPATSICWASTSPATRPGSRPRRRLCSTPRPAPPGATTLVLAGEQLALQIHESVGHAVELDRVLGGEASYAGTSFVAPGDAGSLRYGSELMGITADATLPGALGSYRWDDEGVGAQAIPIVREGVLRGFLSSRESAAEIGLSRSGGCMRAEGFARQPIVRMTNVGLDPGDAGSLDALLASTGRGIYIETNRSWSIDSKRLNFQFAGRGGVGDRGRPARADASRPRLRGHVPGLLGGARRRVLGRRVAPGLGHQLRQGRAGAVGVGVARLRAGAVSRRTGGLGVSQAADLAERALAATGAGEAMVTVTHERSLPDALRALATDPGHVDRRLHGGGGRPARRPCGPGGGQRHRLRGAGAMRPRGATRGRGRGAHGRRRRLPRVPARRAGPAPPRSRPRDRGPRSPPGRRGAGRRLRRRSRGGHRGQRDVDGGGDPHGHRLDGRHPVRGPRDRRVREGRGLRAGRAQRLRLPDRRGGRLPRRPAGGRARGAHGGGGEGGDRDPAPGQLPGGDGAGRGPRGRRRARVDGLQRPGPRRGARGAGREAGHPGRLRRGEPLGLAALPGHAAPGLRRRGRAQGAPAPDPGRRRPPRRARRALGGARRGGSPPATRSPPGALRPAHGPPTW